MGGYIRLTRHLAIRLCSQFTWRSNTFAQKPTWHHKSIRPPGQWPHFPLPTRHSGCQWSQAFYASPILTLTSHTRSLVELFTCPCDISLCLPLAIVQDKSESYCSFPRQSMWSLAKKYFLNNFLTLSVTLLVLLGGYITAVSFARQSMQVGEVWYSCKHSQILFSLKWELLEMPSWAHQNKHSKQ